jgi:phosphatidylglycerophosphate synthase
MNKQLHLTAAFILPPPGGDWYAGTAEIAKIPILLRALHAAQKGGVERFYLVTSPENKKELSDLVESNETFRGEVTWLKQEDPMGQAECNQEQTAAFLVFNANLLFDPRIVKKMVETYDSARVEEKVLVPHFSSSPLSESAGAQLILISSGLLPSLFSGLGKDNHWSCLAEAVRGLDHRKVEFPDHWLYMGISRANLHLGTDALVSHLGKPNDNSIIRYVRKISALIAKPLAYTPVRPNHVTVFAFLLGLLAALSMFQATYGWVVFGALIFVVSWIVDCADGMLARLKLQETRLGAWLDLVLDNIVNVAVFVALTKAVYTQTSNGDLVLYGGGLLVFGAALSFAMVTYHLTHKHDQPKGGSKTGAIIEKVLENLIHRDFCLWLLLFAVIDQLEIFFWTAVAGTNLFAGLFVYVNLKKGLFQHAKINNWRQGSMENK